jgi:hypothetical protein
LSELRYITTEVGYAEAKKMPREIRHWWIDKMNKENKEINDNQPQDQRTRTVTRNV